MPVTVDVLDGLTVYGRSSEVRNRSSISSCLSLLGDLITVGLSIGYRPERFSGIATKFSPTIIKSLLRHLTLYWDKDDKYLEHPPLNPREDNINGLLCDSRQGSLENRSTTLEWVAIST